MFPAEIYSVLGSVLFSDCLLGIFITLLISNHFMIQMKWQSRSEKITVWCLQSRAPPKSGQRCCSLSPLDQKLVLVSQHGEKLVLVNKHGQKLVLVSQDTPKLVLR